MRVSITLVAGLACVLTLPAPLRAEDGRVRLQMDTSAADAVLSMMLAAAGGPDTHPHAHSAPEDRARWDRDVANFSKDRRSVERFFLDVIDGRLEGEDAIREKGFAFFRVQGPWYTVGWKMAALVEETYGRKTLIDCMLDPRRLLATYNDAVKTEKSAERLPLWSSRLFRAVRAQPASGR